MLCDPFDLFSFFEDNVLAIFIVSKQVTNLGKDPKVNIRAGTGSNFWVMSCSGYLTLVPSLVWVFKKNGLELIEPL